jgi:multidrug efflux pump subunit AcrA (membrane-fusion protein)
VNSNGWDDQDGRFADGDYGDADSADQESRDGLDALRALASDSRYGSPDLPTPNGNGHNYSRSAPSGPPWDQMAPNGDPAGRNGGLHYPSGRRLTASDYPMSGDGASLAPDDGMLSREYSRQPAPSVSPRQSRSGALTRGETASRRYPARAPEMPTQQLPVVKSRGVRTRYVAARPVIQSSSGLATQPATRRGQKPRRHMTVAQRLGGLLIAGLCVAGAYWYIPKVVASDEHSLVGTVSSTGVVALNFAANGQIGNIDVQVGQQVKKGQVLATEYDPTTNTIVKADKAAISAAQAKIAEINANPGPGQQASLAAANAELAKDQEQLANDEQSLAATRIVASAPGTVVAVNGQPGEAVTTLGIRDFQSVSGSTPVGQSPQFSLLPEGPQSSVKSSGSASELPVVALRTSENWNVVVLIPQAQVSKIKTDQRVTISVPAAGIKGVPGEIIEVLPQPQSTNQGVAYQAVITVLRQAGRAPLTGMSANVELDT